MIRKGKEQFAIACVKSWVMQLLWNTQLLCGWGACLFFPLQNKKHLEKSRRQSWNSGEWFCYVFILAENRENKLGSITYLHLLLPQTLSFSNHIINQVHICCSVSLTTFLPYEHMMASTHPTGARCSCSWTQPKTSDSIQDFLGFLLFSHCSLLIFLFLVLFSSPLFLSGRMMLICHS